MTERKDDPINLIGWKAILDFMKNENGGVKLSFGKAIGMLKEMEVLFYLKNHPVLNIATYRMKSAMMAGGKKEKKA